MQIYSLSIIQIHFTAKQYIILCLRLYTFDLSLQVRSFPVQEVITQTVLQVHSSAQVAISFFSTSLTLPTHYIGLERLGS